MSETVVVVSVALGMIIGGLLIAWLSSSAGKTASIFWWVGVIVAVLGLFLFVAPIVVYIAGHIRAALGLH